ncbi:MAG: ImmA/IrrE family metallo-endopeptidase [Rhodospirillaceae bacterium]
MTPQKRKAIQQRAAAILNEYDMTSAPVPVERIAKRLEAQVRFSPLDDELSGMVYVKDGTPIIGVNALHHPNRQRFTIAHEVGHLLLHRAEITKEIHVDKDFPMLMRDAVSSTGVNEMEVEANLFAAEILMPADFLVRSLDGQSFDIDDEGAVSALAKEYKVSASAMRFRLGNLFA